MTSFTNRNEQAGYGPNIGGPNANPGGYNNTGPGGPNMGGDTAGGLNGHGMGQYNQTGTGTTGVGAGQDHSLNQRDFGSGGGPTDPAFNNNYPNTAAGHHHKVGGAGVGDGFTGPTGQQHSTQNAGFTGPTGQHHGTQNAGFTGPTGQHHNAGFTDPTGQHHGMQTGGGPATGGNINNNTGAGGAGTNAPGRAANGASAGEKQFMGKVERVAGDVLCSSTLKAKGVEKEREAQALRAQAAELNQAESLESEAAMRRQRAVAHGADPQHLGANGAKRV